MIFSKNEVIELSGGKKYMIVDTMKYEDIWYYYLCEVDNSEKKVNGVFKIITTINENDNLFVKTIKDERANMLEFEFKKRLNIK